MSLELFNREVPEDPQDDTQQDAQDEQQEQIDAADMRGMLAPGKRRAYVLAGRATVTLRSPKTGKRFTYKVTQSDPEPGRMPVWFVGLLSGSDNENDYQYLGTIFADGFRLTRKSRATRDAQSVQVFEWWSRGRWESAQIEVWHEGVCGRCGRTLTVPESIESGLGPICAGKLAA